jgi:FMN phosphatase YigB (HAD superfamily)
MRRRPATRTTPCGTVLAGVDKPHLDFFRTVLQHFSDAIGQEVELARTGAIGDSLTNDICPLLDLGAACGVWLLCERSAFGD